MDFSTLRDLTGLAAIAAILWFTSWRFRNAVRVGLAILALAIVLGFLYSRP